MSMFEPIPSPSGEAANYIVYILDGTGRIRGAEWIAAAGDAEALRVARRLASASPCELWQRARKVARIERRRGQAHRARNGVTPDVTS